MRRVLVLFTMLAVFALCAPSYAEPPRYILVYKGTIALNAYDWENSDLHTETVNCYVVLSIVQTNGTLISSAIVIYGKDEDGDKVYRTQEGTMDLEWSDDFYDADYAILYFYVDDDDNGYVVGKVKEGPVGLESKMPVISNPNGTIQFYEDHEDFLDHSQDLEGSGRVSLTLDSKKTSRINGNATSFIAVVNAIEDDLYDKGYYDYW